MLSYRHLFNALVPVWLPCAIVACADFRGSQSPVFNDPIPKGTLIAQGNFEGQNGRNVSGTAAIYRQDADGLHVVRLEGISMPTGAAVLQVVARANNAAVLTTSLRALTGTQNYLTNVADTRSWESVSIYSPAENIDYAKALLK